MNSAVAGGLAEEGGEMVYLSLGAEITGAVFDSRGAGQPISAGHLCIRPGGLTCACGRHGCLNSYCSAGRLERLENCLRRQDPDF